MALHYERLSRVVTSCSLVISAMVILLFVLAAADESSSRPLTSRKQIQSQNKNGDEGQLRNWISDYGESTWKAFSSQLIRLRSSEDHSEWPELKLGVRTISAIILGALAAAMCSAAGLGGGILFVPLLKLLLHFDAKTAAALSNFLILGGTTVGVALNLMRDHPNEFNKPLVDFDIALLLQPNMLLGTSIGVILNTVLPNWLITALLMVMLVYMTYNTMSTGLKRWESETRLAIAKKNPKKKTLVRSNTESEKALTESLLGFYQSLSSRYPVKAIVALLFMWLAVFAVQILRGGHGRKGLVDVSECGVGYWLLTASQIPVAFGVTAWVIFNLRASAAAREPSTSESRSDIRDQGYVMGPKQGLVFSGMALLAGMVAGMLGIGGTMIINPLLLSAGVLPQVTAATSLFMVFFSSSMSVAQYWLLGRVPVGYALIGTLICGVSAAVGVTSLQRIVSKYGRPSLIVFAVAAVIGLSAILMGIFGTRDVWNQYQAGEDMGFSYPC